MLDPWPVRQCIVFGKQRLQTGLHSQQDFSPFIGAQGIVHMLEYSRDCRDYGDSNTRWWLLCANCSFCVVLQELIKEFPVCDLQCCNIWEPKNSPVNGLSEGALKQKTKPIAYLFVFVIVNAPHSQSSKKSSLLGKNNWTLRHASVAVTMRCSVDSPAPLSAFAICSEDMRSAIIDA